MNLVYVTLCAALICRSYGSVVHDIYAHLFNSTYNPNIRPVFDWNTKTVVKVGLSIVAVIEFDEVKQTLMATGKLDLEWHDEYLRWNAEQFGNVTHIHVPQDLIWKPYIFLENAVNRQSELGTPSLRAIVAHNGSVAWSPTEIFHSTCSANVKKFPFDIQTCSMVFETYGYTEAELAIESISDVVMFHSLVGAAGWSILRSSVETVSEDGARHVLCSLTLKRNPVYFVLNTILPIILLSWMNICVFVLPVSSGEKASYVVTVFLSLAVFLTIVSEKLPENSKNIAVLNTFVFVNTLLSVIIAIITLIQIRIHHRDQRYPVSSCLSSFTRMFVSLSCCQGKKISHEPLQENKDGQDLQDKCLTRTEQIPSVRSEEETGKEDTSHEKVHMKVTWPDVVKATDNVFLIIFSLINIAVTLHTVFVIKVETE